MEQLEEIHFILVIFIWNLGNKLKNLEKKMLSWAIATTGGVLARISEKQGLSTLLRCLQIRFYSV